MTTREAQNAKAEAAKIARQDKLLHWAVVIWFVVGFLGTGASLLLGIPCDETIANAGITDMGPVAKTLFLGCLSVGVLGATIAIISGIICTRGCEGDP